MGEWLTEYEVRDALAQHDEPIHISHDQLVKWRTWGLLEQRPDRRWAPNTVDKVARIHELGKSVDSYARRVIVLYAESFRVVPPRGENRTESSEEFFRIPLESLRRAMVDVAPKIRPHLKKMKAVEAAIGAVFRRSLPDPYGRGSKLPRGWRPPPHEKWVPILEETPTEIFASRASIQYYFAALLETSLQGEPEGLTWIPFEERVVLLTVRDLATWHHFQREAREEMDAAQGSS